MPSKGRRRSALSAIVEDTHTEETVLEEPKAVEVEKEDTPKSPLLKEIIKEESSILSEQQLMEIDTLELIRACKTMGYDIPSEGKNTNKKIRSIILDNGGQMPTTFVSGEVTTTPKVAEMTGILEPTQVTSKGKVYIEKSVTKNMGDYNSAKVTVGIELPIDYVDEELDRANDTVSVALELVDKRLEDEVEKLM